MTTIFGPDISSFQSGLVLSRLADASFVIAKTTEGTYYTDKDYQGWRRQAAALKKSFAWYHFLSGEGAAPQAAHTAANVGDVSLPGMLDAEPEGSFHPSLAQIVDYIDAAHAAGLNLRLLYLPRWYWEQIGSPSLSAVKARGVSLVSSAYPGGTGSAPSIYPGDGAAGWGSYGGMTPLIYQFTNKASDGGQPLDYNAFRGTQAQLVAALAPASTTTSGGTDMADNVIPASIAHHFPGLDLSADFPANAPFDEATSDIWGDGRAEAAWRYALMANQKLDTLLARQAPTADEIGAAVASHLTAGGGASAADIAAAVGHLFAQKLSS